jgi:queuine/archaeosine tRNA-ribosyltransferase
MPDDCKGKSLAVVQGRTTEQVDYCLESHLSLGIGRLGFGSFGTNGKQSNSNIVTAEALSLLKYVTGIASDDGIELHAFGVGTPPVIYLLNESGVASFDSIGWMKTAGFGKVYLPFMRAYNITYRDKSARGMTQDVFEELKIRSGHECAFCANFDDLAAKRNYRILHNLAAIQDTVDLIHTQPTSKKLLQMMADYSPTYSRLRSVAES